MLYKSNQWIEDIDKVIAYLPELDDLAGKSLLITGAAGLICSSVVDIIFRYNDRHNGKIQILAAGRQLEEMICRFYDLVKRDDFHYIRYDASHTDNTIAEKADYIIHGASNAFPSLILQEPVETMMSNFVGVKFLLDYAKKQGTKRVLYISSSEVYGKKDDDQPFKEGEYGYIDILNPRNSYSVGKRAAETLCVSFSYEYNVESVIVRPGHIYGPTASPYDNRVASAWAYQAAEGKDIVMKSDGTQLRSYCYCLDCASAILKVLLCGKNSNAYNISNPNSIITIRQLGEILAKAGGVQLNNEFPSNEEKKGFNPMSNSSLEGKEILNLGWHPCFSAEIGLNHTVKILNEAQNDL